jgi:hypothetical protein
MKYSRHAGWIKNFPDVETSLDRGPPHPIFYAFYPISFSGREIADARVIQLLESILHASSSGIHQFAGSKSKIIVSGSVSATNQKFLFSICIAFVKQSSTLNDYCQIHQPYASGRR